jgi:outer membrane protein OmpA-like peptidoglycan-associated protein
MAQGHPRRGGLRRASALADLSFPRPLLSAKGYEGSVPLYDPKTEEGRTKNPRVEFIIVR